MNKLAISTLVVLTLLSSCKKNTTTQPENATISLDKIYDEQSNLKRAFAKSLLKCMQESPRLRTLIKSEALKMFDKDYEVLYYTIKDNTLENGLTVDAMISKYLESTTSTQKILSQYPTLTILIPELPEKTFSAPIWNTNDVIPAVAVRTDAYNDVPYIKTDGTEAVMAAKYTPGFPIIVVCENERVIANTKSTDFDDYNTRVVYEGNGVKLRFWADGFDNTIGNILVDTTEFDTQVTDAYNIYENAKGWQRDYIYYNITPSSPNGPFNPKFKEYLGMFQMNAVEGDKLGAYYYVSNQAGAFIGTQCSAWSSNRYEFKLKLGISADGDNHGEFIQGFSVAPDAFFNIVYNGTQNGNQKIYTISEAIPNNVQVNAPLFKWDIKTYSGTFKIGIEEIDLPSTTSMQVTRNFVYAVNFGIDSLGDPTQIVKLGPGYGFPTPKVKYITKTVNISNSQRSKELYECIVNFGDKALINKTVQDGKNVYKTYPYSTGKCSFSIEPQKVQ